MVGVAVMMSLAGHSRSSDSEVWLCGWWVGGAGAAPQEPVVDTWTWVLRHLLLIVIAAVATIHSFLSFQFFHITISTH